MLYFDLNFSEICHEVLIRISLKFVLKGFINNKLSLIQILARCPTGDKLIYEAVMAQFNYAYQWVSARKQ